MRPHAAIFPPRGPSAFDKRPSRPFGLQSPLKGTIATKATSCQVAGGLTRDAGKTLSYKWLFSQDIPFLNKIYELVDNCQHRLDRVEPFHQLNKKSGINLIYIIIHIRFRFMHFFIIIKTSRKCIIRHQNRTYLMSNVFRATQIKPHLIF